MQFKCATALILGLMVIQAAQATFPESLDIFKLIYAPEIPALNDISSVKVDESNMTPLHQEIIKEFDKIDIQLEEILKPAPGKNDPFGPPVKNRTKCTVSEEELIKLKDQIKDIMHNVSSSGGKCDLAESSEDNCKAWLKLIQCGVKELGDGFRKASLESLEEIAKWKRAYDSLLERYRKDVDNVKASLTKEFEKRIDQLTEELQRLSALIVKAQEEIKRTYVKLCISEISNGKTAEAVAIFKRLKDPTLLGEIVKTSFKEYGKRSNVNHIIDFVKKLPHCDHDRIAYPLLFALMKDSSSLVKPEVVSLYEAVQPCMCKSDLKKELQKYAS